MLIEKLRGQSSLDDVFSLGAQMKGNNNQVQKLYKVTENVLIDEKFPGTYYGEHSFNL